MLHGSKEGLVKHLTICNHLSSTVSEILQVIGRKLRHFHTPPLFSDAAEVTQSEFREDLDIHKTRMNVLSCVEESMTICSAVLIQYQRVADGRTDRRPAYIYYVLQQLTLLIMTKKQRSLIDLILKQYSQGHVHLFLHRTSH